MYITANFDNGAELRRSQKVYIYNSKTMKVFYSIKTSQLSILELG